VPVAPLEFEESSGLLESPGRRWVVRMSRFAAALAGVVSLLFLLGCEPLTTNELQHEAESIHSTAAEGALLADGVARQRTLSSFVRAHAKELADAADTSARKLHDATVPHSLRRATRRAIDLATRTSAVLGGLELSPSNPQQASGFESRLEHLAAAAAHLEGSS
jgi:hypothetical protein